MESLKIQAYFNSESEAESAKMSLQKVNASDFRIEEMPQNPSDLILIPIPRSGVGVPPAGRKGALGNSIEKRELGSGNPDENSEAAFVAEFKVNRKDLEETLGILQEKGAYIDEEASSDFVK
ncbi:hypothetical protein CR205_00200 [Alteribacter lacisalsi]|uniref:Uncharacterized protein n=1 Tax=Alteribacter lacisalsi TaxID=2045244 RepID=A0A2W0H8K2_9BACI|nr:hypothetical protein [Alteribacter lacisalsi]PYZ97066.1 hypothetical protein CR205_00200 [Alteribacter lacisalsi]